jgi:hypothetical protein
MNVLKKRFQLIYKRKMISIIPQEKRFALVSVSDRTGIVQFARELKKLGFEIIASRKTAELLRQSNLDVTEVSTITKYPPIIGRKGIKLIHPLIFGGILVDKTKKEHLRDLKKYGIKPFEIVVCNFYPFEKVVSRKGFKHEKAVENIDIGGPAMVRCAVKNYKNVAVLFDPKDYQGVLDELKLTGRVSMWLKKQLALKAFNYTRSYDEHIVKYLSSVFNKNSDEKTIECKRCANNSKNPTIIINKDGLCNICELYKNNFNKKNLLKELKMLKSFIGSGKQKYDAMVGISGGKDSTTTLYTAKELGFKPLAFTFDIGYYPRHIYPRARWVAEKLGVDHVTIPIRKYIQKHDRISYQKTAELYGKKISKELENEFKRLYIVERKYYSVKSSHSAAFVRTCHLCRHTVIRAYYQEALKRGIKVVILGINEWAGLSQNKMSKKYTISAIRKLKPYPNKPPVYIVHLPFLLQRSISDTTKILKRIGWKIPKGEALVETNSNSCLFARAAESKAMKLLGFHPDSTRLSREVTVGYITKKQAKDALKKIHVYRYSVRQVLQKARII